MTSPQHNSSEIAAFHRHIAHCLSLEWQLAASWLPQNVRTAFREPGFSLTEHGSVLGQWVSQPVREIRIARHCVIEHPWYAVVDILKHEMAHQLADEVLGCKEETAHGESFHLACRFLGANPAASGTYPTLDQVILEEKSGADDTILAKIGKLLALAESTNRHEAERAMTKARELMARHCLDPTLRPDRSYVTLCLGKPALRHSLEAHALASLLRDFYFVTPLWIPMVVPEKGRIGRVLEVSGTPTHVRLAHYVYDYVRHVIDSEWKRYGKGRGFGRNGRRDFSLGIIKGFRGLLTRQTEASPELQALVRRGDPDLDRYVDERHPRRRKRRPGRSTRVNAHLMREGERTAQRIGIRKGIANDTGSDAARRALPPGKG